MKLRPRTRLVIPTVFVFIATIGVSVVSATQSRPTLAQLESMISHSVDINHSPNLTTSIPPLLSIESNDGTATNMPTQCYSTADDPPIPSNADTLCAFGDKSSARSILVFGDSQSAMWVPAMNVVGVTLGWKIVYLGKPGCAPWIDPKTVDFLGHSRTGCMDFTQNVIRFANRTKPRVVIPIGLSGDYGRGQYPTFAESKADIDKLGNELKPSRASLLFFGEIPWYSSDYTKYTPATCLAYQSTNLIPCLVTPKEQFSNSFVQDLATFANSAGGQYLNINPLFCTKSRCALFVKALDGSHLIYQDAFHMNRWYSEWIGNALATLIKPLLPAK
jgi:hypothetical protein